SSDRLAHGCQSVRGARTRGKPLGGVYEPVKMQRASGGNQREHDNGAGGWRVQAGADQNVDCNQQTAQQGAHDGKPPDRTAKVAPGNVTAEWRRKTREELKR